MKFAIDPGHNCNGDGGAKGVKENENELIMKVTPKIISKLKALGHTVVDCRPKSSTNSLRSSLNQRTRTANNHNCDVFVSIHFNAFNGQAHGCEVLYFSTAGKKIATPVVEEIAKLGFFNRGLKYRNNLHVLKATRMPAILVECCFCDSWKDIHRFDAEKMAIAIVKGLVPNSPSSPCPTCGRS